MRSFLVLPPEKTAAAQLRETIQDSLDGSAPSSRKALLPDTIGGETVRYRHMPFRISLFFLFASILSRLFGPLLYRSRRQEKETRRREELMLDYPGLVDRMTLYMLAGMSQRRALGRIALDYKADLAKTGRRPGYDLLLDAYYEMQKGVPEDAAYRRIGFRAGLPAYRPFAELLIQSLEKGGAGVLSLLKQEAAAASENRLKAAKIRGEKAGTKLLLPMLLMLGIVLAVLIIPALIKLM